jgi:hypothetical protein
VKVLFVERVDLGCPDAPRVRRFSCASNRFHLESNSGHSPSALALRERESQARSAESHSVSALVGMVADVVGRDRVIIETTPTSDHCCDHISSERVKCQPGYEPAHTVEDTVRDLTDACARGWIPESMTDPRDYSITTMLAARL